MHIFLFRELLYMNSTCNVLFRECMNYMVVWFFTLCSWTANPIHMDGKDLCRSLQQHRQDSHPTIEIFGPMPLLTLSGCLWDRPNERINWRLREPMGISPKAELVRVGTGARAAMSGLRGGRNLHLRRRPFACPRAVFCLQ